MNEVELGEIARGFHIDRYHNMGYSLYDMPKTKKKLRTVRRSVALPRDLVETAQSAAKGELRENFNRLVRTALEEFIERRERLEFDRAMARMAKDPDIQKANRQFSRDFEETESDGLLR